MPKLQSAPIPVLFHRPFIAGPLVTRKSPEIIMLMTPLSLRMSVVVKVLTLLMATSVVASCATNMRTEKASENLVEVEPGNFDHVLMQPDTPLSSFTRVSIAQPDVAMSEYWLRDHHGDYSDRDLERIREDYSRFLKEALAEILAEKSQVQIVESQSDADVVLRPSLINLNIYGPDLSFPGRVDHYIESAGNATLNLQLVDAQSGEILAQFVDHRETPAIVIGRLEETNRVTNNRLFRRLMERWSYNLVDYLDREGIVSRR
jgi:hypothetical protein